MSDVTQLLKLAAEKKAREKEKKTKPILELSSDVKYSQPVLTTTNPSQAVPITSKQIEKIPVSPQRNFTKVSNSITTDAIPQGFFKGLSKHTYDVLYKLTRGAIKPVREIQLTRLELMKLTGLSENTQRVHIKYLSVAGLLKVSYQTGKHEGATYEVFVPEEVGDNYAQMVSSTTNQYQVVLSSTNDSQNLGGDKYQQLGVVGTTLKPENAEQNDDLRLSLKTNTIDDELTRRLDGFSRQNSGRDLSVVEREKISELVDLLMSELEQAAAKTDSISNIPAFLIEHLRRKLLKPISAPGTKQTSPIRVTTEKINRKVELETLRDIFADGGMDEVEKWRGNYTPEDWEWLMNDLEK